MNHGCNWGLNSWEAEISISRCPLGKTGGQSSGMSRHGLSWGSTSFRVSLSLNSIRFGTKLPITYFHGSKYNQITAFKISMYNTYNFIFLTNTQKAVSAHEKQRFSLYDKSTRDSGVKVRQYVLQTLRMLGMLIEYREWFLNLNTSLHLSIHPFLPPLFLSLYIYFETESHCVALAGLDSAM